jgi:hypothetical protein
MVAPGTKVLFEGASAKGLYFPSDTVAGVVMDAAATAADGRQSDAVRAKARQVLGGEGLVLVNTGVRALPKADEVVVLGESSLVC